ncbi:Uncharacterized membrane protein YdjX, TVP38/TMEM64 family, SNARE-associated domain [Humidesulfovibrio mexicanus]|uniref:TVP38/TMEM64 family membrane protein n=2 Tax=Humidesulfovibrio mexicanus TaxID=147047 RepID=A0A239D2T9_9BACT|nr:Uncharacterized membrane protein YdjX, TVP38/TMEM64 family, SNARE-associated domain [Humidesulfovibrio mexicanus]
MDNRATRSRPKPGSRTVHSQILKPWDMMNPKPSPAASRPPFAKARQVALVLLFIIFASLAWRLWDQNLLNSEGVLLAVREHPLLAPVAFIGIYALAMLFMLPTMPLNIGAGFLWGTAVGGAFSLLGSSLGATLAFSFARSAFGQPFARGFNLSLLSRLGANMEKTPWKVIAFVRLNPAVPSGVVNFLLGLTSMPLRTYVWGTILFSAPLCLVFSHLGQLTGGFMLSGDTGRLVRIVAICLGVALFLYAGRHMLSRRQGAVQQSANTNTKDTEQPR